MTSYAIRRIQVISALKLGTVVGTLSLLVPGLLIGIIVRVMIRVLRQWLESWDIFGLPGGIIEIRILDILNLESFLTRLQGLDERGWLLIIAITTGTMALGGLFSGLMAAFSAQNYNALAAITGGVVVDAVVVETAESPAPQIPPAARRITQIMPGPQPQNNAPRVWLVSRQDPQKRWPLKSETTTLGGAIGNDIVLTGLAPRHAEIRFEAGRYVLHDLSNGQSWVNNRPVQGLNMIKEGFVIRLGQYEFTFHRQ